MGRADRGLVPAALGDREVFRLLKMGTRIEDRRLRDGRDAPDWSGYDLADTPLNRGCRSFHGAIFVVGSKQSWVAVCAFPCLASLSGQIVVEHLCGPACRLGPLKSRLTRIGVSRIESAWPRSLMRSVIWTEILRSCSIIQRMITSSGQVGANSSRCPRIRFTESFEASEPSVESRALAAYFVQPNLECHHGADERLLIAWNQCLQTLARCGIRMVVDVLRRDELGANRLELGYRCVREYPPKRFHV